MRCLPLTLLLMLAVETAIAQSSPPPAQAPVTSPVESTTQADTPPPPDEIVEVVRGTRRMTTKITFVVDTSGSMDNYGRVGQAINFARNILGQPGDDLLVSLYAFKDGFSKWEGLPPDPAEQRAGPPPPDGWTEFPGVPQQEAAQRWLNDQGANGGTNPIGAMSSALSQDMRDLTIVLITDGEFAGYAAQFIAAIEAKQAERVSKGLGRAVIFVIGTGAGAEQAHLRTVAQLHGGGLHIIRRPQIEEEEETPVTLPPVQLPPIPVPPTPQKP